MGIKQSSQAGDSRYVAGIYLMRAAGAAAVLLHFVAAGVAGEFGWPYGVLAFFLPVVAEAFAVVVMSFKIGLLNPYTLSLAAVIAVFAVGARLHRKHKPF